PEIVINPVADCPEPRPMATKTRPKNHRPRSIDARTTDEWQLSNNDCDMILADNLRPPGMSRYFLLFRLATYLNDVRRLALADCIEMRYNGSRQVSTTRDSTLRYDATRQAEHVFRLNVHHRGLAPAPLASQQLQ